METEQITAIDNLIKEITRPGIKELWARYREEFLKCPASSRFHGAYEGGLAHHSKKVITIFSHLLAETNEMLQKDTIFIVSIFHDLCKIGKYIWTGSKFITNINAKPGHAKLSVEKIEEYLKLTPLEKELITFHMGIFGLDEYTAEELKQKTQENYLIQVFACADMIASKLEK